MEELKKTGATSPVNEDKDSPSNVDAVDTSYLDAAMDIKLKQIEPGLKMTPEEIPEIDLKLRDGRRHDGPFFTIDGDELPIRVPQLTILQLRKAERMGLKALGDSVVGKKLIVSMRTKSRTNKKIDLNFNEQLELQVATDIQNIWLCVFALREAGYVSITGDDVKDFDFVNRLPITFFDLLVKAIRKENGILEGASDVEFFRDHGSRGDAEKRDPSHQRGNL